MYERSNSVKLRFRELALSIILLICFVAGVFYLWEQKDIAPGPVINNRPGYDVIVVGGEPEGIAAAVSAARNGLKTLLIEDDYALGGLFTLGQLNFLDMNHGPKHELLTRGIFEEFYKAMGNAFDVEEAKEYFFNLVHKEKNITLKLNTAFVEPIMEGNKIMGVRVKEKGEVKEYLGLRVIDATVDADVAAAAGVPYTIGAEDYGEKGTLMGVTLVFRVAGVNWDRVVKYLKYEDNDPHSGADQVAAWGYGKEAREYKPRDKMRFRGPNIARQKDGTVLINALLIFGVDGLDSKSKAEGIERGKREIPYIIEFMRQKFPGFENARFVGTAEQLYVRETRHIIGEYRLTITDVLENRDHWDRIGHGSYPVDVQPTSPSNFGNVIGVPDIYSIPFRSLVPLKVDDLLVVGRSASYDSLPHGSARVIPVGMVAGEAAGVASAYSIQNNVIFRDMTKSKEAITWVQERLKKQGAYLVEYTPPRPKVMDHWAYPGVRVMRELGLIEGGYTNDYGLERKATKWSMENKLNKVLRLAHERNSRVPLRKVEIPPVVTGENMVMFVAEGLSGEKLSFSESLALLKGKGILTREIESRVTDWKEIPDFAQMLSLLANLYEHLLKQ
ncbi:FAD-dependent oxidoreductase [Thermanaerosceptrum fracticalcis]|uniref:FAD-dependent oxidoreductase n=1 Tax=Thermanaerosceptrum fracticalcis TaxID=1712410 RepID=A0A7G6E4I5_THEFR|nr:FAD-dependent oxidoreductase [Thermanaerosceptrum fracticalcis]